MLEPVLVDGEESPGHDGVDVGRPDVGFSLPLVGVQLLPLEPHVPVHEALQVLLDERVPERRVVDGVNHRRNNQLKINK